MKIDFLNQRMADGSRLFTILPGELSWARLREHLEKQQYLSITDFVTDGVTEAWLDFRFFDEAFSIHCPLDEYYVFAKNGECATLILYYLMKHLRKLEV